MHKQNTNIFGNLETVKNNFFLLQYQQNESDSTNFSNFSNKQPSCCEERLIKYSFSFWKRCTTRTQLLFLYLHIDKIFPNTSQQYWLLIMLLEHIIVWQCSLKHYACIYRIVEFSCCRVYLWKKTKYVRNFKV